VNRGARAAIIAAVGLLLIGGAVVAYLGEGVDGEGIITLLGAFSMYVTSGVLVLKVPENALSWLLLVVTADLGIMILFETCRGRPVRPGAQTRSDLGRSSVQRSRYDAEHVMVGL
jgi:hypothetical protein